MKHSINRSIAGLAALAMLFSMTPVFAQRAVTISADANSDAESVIARDGDTPLERHAKLHRAWTVYREVDSDQIWAVRKEAKTKHEVQTLEFFTAFNANYHILLVRKGAMDRFETGDPITSGDLDPADWRKEAFRCRLVKVADQPAVYLVCHGRKRVVLREGVFHRFGWEFRDVETISQEELDSYKDGDSVDEETVFDETVEVDSTNARLLRERLQTRLDLRGKTNVRTRLIKRMDRPEVYILMPDGRLRLIPDEDAARRNNIDLKDLTEVSGDELDAFEVEGTLDDDDL